MKARKRAASRKSGAKSSRIHPTAIVDRKAEIDASVEIGPYTIVGPGVEIGADTWIGPHVVLQGPLRIGRNNRIYQFASVGELSQDKTATADQPSSAAP
jgi:UDP-N-acetylglucosamine acyltransferase